MNKIEVKGSKISSNFNLLIKNNTITLENIDVIITFIETNDNYNFVIKDNVKIFEYYKTSKVNNNYQIKENSSFILNRFSNNCSIESTIDLAENSCLNYKYSCLNYSDNLYIINVNHNKNSISKIKNIGINLSSSKLDFLINANVSKTSTNVITNQDSKIFLLKDNNSSIKPNLIIDNNEIDASHQAYLGSYNNEELFYLQCRGLSLDDSKKLLTKAYLVGEMDIDYSCLNMILNDLNDNWRC